MTTQPAADPSTAMLVETGRRTMSLSYAPAPIVMDRGEGCELIDRDGRRYLDFLAGIAVDTLGHAHPALTEALRDQVGRVLHVSNAFFTEPQVLLQQRLTDGSFADRVFFCNSGAEANEAAIKLVRRWQRVVRGTPAFEIITFDRSFHGRTYAAISATAQPKYHAGFEPMVPGFVYATYGDLASVEARIGVHTAGILVEPVQGEGGVRPAEPEFLQGLRSLCDRHGLALMFDEVQCGVGRVGELFAYQHYGVTPDVMSLAKGIGGGVPLGAMLATDELAQGFERGSHATTYGGNPLATRAGLTVLETIERDGLLENVRAMGERLRSGLRDAMSGHGAVREVRGLGLMVGVELDADASQAGAVVAASRERGLLHNTAGGNVLRLVPPLVVGTAEVDRAVSILAEAVRATI